MMTDRSCTSTARSVLRRRLERQDVAANRYHDRRLGAEVVNIVVGGCVVTDDPNVVITTTLGSCVAACLYDPVAEIGGMNHFLLPDAGSDTLSLSSRYGATAMEQLINRLLKVTGRRDRLRAKLFGGANVNLTTLRSANIGQRNVEFVMEYLATEGIPTVSWDVGGASPRAVRFFPTTGRSQRRLIGDETLHDIARNESSYIEHLRKSRIEGDVELF
ncbi:chemotaxis protein CheD [Azospirillum oryzae]|uniref:Probable chemoreceptor glutamine deamidase CheD n=1 Tax=Azospirillum oryzae TaxID=286727 RepID=A0A1X7HS93_9PROT|nr:MULTISPECIES: chemotaxis protein [Azospirillum]PWC61296.1 chemotaxis protein [Azospirillum sp. TSH7]PWC64231.1 chemotaxis protein [Azospirillum sp. TSH20]SMF91550.1 chemotaxis protein CheD [Azospirillum oryzae]